MAALMHLTPERRAVAAALAFLLAAFLAGVNPGPQGVRYAIFGVTEGLAAILLSFAFLQRQLWWSEAGVLRWVAVGYGTLANAQILELLLPPPGVLEWMVLTGLAFGGWALLAASSRERMLAGLATVALLLALLRFSIVPIVWDRAGPGPGEAWGLGNLAEGMRRLVVDHQPVTAGGEVLGVVAIAIWAVGTRLLWKPTRKAVARPIKPPPTYPAIEDPGEYD